MNARQLMDHLSKIEPDAEIFIPVSKLAVGPCSHIRLDRFVPNIQGGRQWCELVPGTDFNQNKEVEIISK